MPLLHHIVLAVVQGITEFLPISSSAHLILVPTLAPGWEDQGALIDVAAHVGTLAAVLLYFRTETGALFRGGVNALTLKWTPDTRLFALISAATIPTLIIGGALYALDIIDALRSPIVIAWTTIGFGVVLFVADRFGARSRTIDMVGWRGAILIGLSQAIALVPGTSRSGITMSAARALGYDRPDAARFSMLMAIPVILAFGGFTFLELLQDGIDGALTDALIVAVLSCICALGAIHIFLKMAARTDFTIFVLYRLALGAALLWWFA